MVFGHPWMESRSAQSLLRAHGWFWAAPENRSHAAKLYMPFAGGDPGSGAHAKQPVLFDQSAPRTDCLSSNQLGNDGVKTRFQPVFTVVDLVYRSVTLA